VGRGTEFKAQVFPLVSEGGIMGLWVEIQSPLARMAIIVVSRNAAKPT